MITTVIAIVSLVISLFTFLFFDIRIKKQERLLNEYRIAEYQAADKQRLMAHLSFETYWRDKGTLNLIVENEGPSDARNIVIKDLDEESFLFRDVSSQFPLTVIAGDSVQIALLVYHGMPDKTWILITWEDDSGENHQEKAVLRIN